jgi:ABC-2 type transport system permease protein
MNGIVALVKRDLKFFFLSPQFYWLAFICTLLWSPIYIYSFGVFLTQVVSILGGKDAEYLTYQSRVLSEFVALIHFLLLILVNSVTMRLLSEEKRNHTYTLLMTSPISSWHIIIAKFIVGFVVTASLVVIAFLYPVTTSFLGKVEWAPVFCSFIGLLFFVALYVAVGLMVSAMTKSVLMAFVLALIVNLGLWFLGSGSEAVESPFWVAFFNVVNLDPVFKDFTQGVFRLQGLAFVVSLTVFFLVATERITEATRWE